MKGPDPDPPGQRQSGLTYVEVLVATLILATALVPALQALHGAAQTASVVAGQSAQRLRLGSALETVLAEPYGNLLAAAGAVNDRGTPTSYSDPAGTTDRRLVHVSFYDIANLDGDGDPFTIADPDTDGDSNPYTGGEVAIDLLWVQVTIEGAADTLETLTGLY